MDLWPGSPGAGTALRPFRAHRRQLPLEPAQQGADTTGPYAGVPYDGNDPAFEDLYIPNKDYPDLRRGGGPWYTENPWWHERWYAYVKEIVDVFQPDLLYSDGGVPSEIGP